MERIGTLLVAPSTERKAEPGRFTTALRSATTELVSGIAGGVALAAPYVPGGAVLAGALRPTVPPVGAPAIPAGVAGPAIATGAAATIGAHVTSGVAAAAGPGTTVPSTAPTFAPGGGDVMEATRALQAQAQTFNLQYLQLQESMQRESREFTSLTNVMKVRHDSAKAAIGNIH